MSTTFASSSKIAAAIEKAQAKMRALTADSVTFMRRQSTWMCKHCKHTLPVCEVDVTEVNASRYTCNNYDGYEHYVDRYDVICPSCSVLHKYDRKGFILYHMGQLIWRTKKSVEIRR